MLLQNSQIVANAFAGRGGNITIKAEVVLADPTSQVSALSALGIHGLVEVRAPVTDISGSIAPLPQAFAPVAELLRDRCTPRLREARASRFVRRGREGVPVGPDGVLLSPLGLSGPSAVLEDGGPRRVPLATKQARRGGRGCGTCAGEQEADGSPGEGDLECARWRGEKARPRTRAH